MSIDSLVDSKNNRLFSTVITYSSNIIGSAVPGIATSIGAAIFGNLFFGIAQTIGFKPGPMDMNNSLLYVATISPITIQFFYHSFAASRKQKAPEFCYGPHLPHGYQTVYEILHGTTSDKEITPPKELGTLYQLPARNQPPAA